MTGACTIRILALTVGASGLLWGQPIVRPRAAGPKPLRAIQKKKAAPHPLLERIDRMAPADREKFFNLIPDEGKRDAMRRRWEIWNRMPPDERERLGALIHELPNLPPQRLEAARLLFRRFSELPQDRQTAIREEVAEMRKLSPEERRARVNSDEFRNQFSDPEKRLMLDMARVFPSGAPPQPVERPTQ